ncbi:MAG: hypothetical protein KY433_08645 [Actinobacteria bacterium]|nr:hypothetical protein [Actinomycetota bacterium]
MPLKLVTGPANAEKAKVVLDGYRAALRRGAGPILVVPRLQDVERYRAELATSGVVFGAQVVRFAWLIEECARRGGLRARPLGTLARERIAASAVKAAPLQALARSARTRGFTTELLALFDELEELRVTPQRLTQALRAWAAGEPRRLRYAEEVSGLYAGYRRTLERLGRLDARLYEAAALDALRENPAAWGDTPVFFYGFDDLQPLQRDAVETIAATGAQVTLSLSYEPGRMAFAGRATAFAELYREDVAHVALEPRAEHYAPASRTALHHLERGLFELDETQLFDPDPVDPGAAITLLQGGGERAELELVAAEAARLVREEGVAPEEIAVVLRRPGEHAALLGEVFGAFGLRVALERKVAFGHTPLGRGLVGLARCAGPAARADDLIAYLRTPGRVREQGLVDRLEARARRGGPASAAVARAAWEEIAWPLGELDRLAGLSGARLVRELENRLERLFGAPYRGAAHVLAGPELEDARACAQGARRSSSSRRWRAPIARSRPSPTSSRRCCTTSTSTSERAPAPASSPSPSRWRCARAACGSCSPAGCRKGSFPRRLAPSPSSPTPSASRSPRPPGCGCAAATSSAPSAISSTRRSRGPRSASTCHGTRPATTASRRCARSSCPMSATSSARSSPSAPARARSARSAGPTAPRRASASACAARRSAGRAGARRRWRRCATRRSSRRCATGRPGRRRGSSCGRAARCGGSSSGCSRPRA